MQKFKVYWHIIGGEQKESTAHTIEVLGDFIVATGELGQTWMKKENVDYFVTQFLPEDK